MNILFNGTTFLLLLLNTVTYAKSSPLDSIKVCNGLILKTNENVEFNSNERLLICGESEIAEWKKIPDYQVEYHLKAILQAKGFHFLKFNKKGNDLVVNTGPKIYIDKIIYKGMDVDVDQDNYIASLNKEMTPKELGEIKSYFLGRLAESGYPCAEIETKGFAKERDVEVNVELNNKRVLAKVLEMYDERFYPSLFQRFYAFQLNKPYDAELIDLTHQRIMNSGVVLHNQFSEKCDGGSKDEVYLDQKVLLGKSKFFSFGIGGSTEDGPLIQARWKNGRIGKNGSQANISLYASFRQQRVQLLGSLYPFKNLPRTFFEPSVTVRKINEPQLETLEASTEVLYGITKDTMKNRYELRVGPAYTYYDAIEAALNTTQYYPSLKIKTSITSHDFEYNLSDPRGGYNLSFNTEIVSDNLGSDFNAYQFKLNGHYLKNIGDYYPAHLILGFRFGLMTTIGTDQNRNIADIPLNFRYYIGGAQNLRGFERQELPRGGNGAPSAFYTSIEARSYTVINEKWQPLTFLDVGLLGQESTALEVPIYWSPGIGMRWDSPIGVFRTTLAHGFISKARSDQPDELSHLQYFLSFGKEF